MAKFKVYQKGLSIKDENSLETARKLADFRDTAKKTWISVKRKSITKAIREFKENYEPKAFYCKYRLPDQFYADDVVEVYYKA